MSSQTAEPMPVACPRCREASIQVLSTSPVAGVWTLFACRTCLYAWRSTEPEENRDPEKYPGPFRLDPATIPDLPIAPQIPALRKAGSGD